MFVSNRSTGICGEKEKNLLCGCKADVDGQKSDEGSRGGGWRTGGDGLVIVTLVLQPFAYFTHSQPPSLLFFYLDSMWHPHSNSAGPNRKLHCFVKNS